MGCNCKVSGKSVKTKNQYKHFKPKTHENFDNCKHIKVTIEIPLLKDIDRLFLAFIIELKKNSILIL